MRVLEGNVIKGKHAVERLSDCFRLVEPLALVALSFESEETVLIDMRSGGIRSQRNQQHRISAENISSRFFLYSEIFLTCQNLVTDPTSPLCCPLLALRSIVGREGAIVCA